MRNQLNCIKRTIKIKGPKSWGPPRVPSPQAAASDGLCAVLQEQRQQQQQQEKLQEQEQQDLWCIDKGIFIKMLNTEEKRIYIIRSLFSLYMYRRQPTAAHEAPLLLLIRKQYFSPLFNTYYTLFLLFLLFFIIILLFYHKINNHHALFLLSTGGGAPHPAPVCVCV